MPTVKIIIKGAVIVKYLPTILKSEIIADLTFSNPKYISALKSGGWIPADMPKYIYFCSKGGEDILYVPKGYMNTLLSKLQAAKIQPEIIDHTVAPDKEQELKFLGTLRDYQDEAKTEALSRRYGVLEAATGAGKTVIAIATIPERQTKTLIVVHSKELLNQWVERLEQYLGLHPHEIGIIAGNKMDLQKPICIGIINSVHNRLDLLYGVFGYLICDECHRTPGDTWTTMINSLNVKYMLGLTATPFRSDNLTKAIFCLLGPKLHVVNKAQLVENGSVLVPKVIRVDTDFRYNFKNDYTSMVSAISSDCRRNMLLASTVAQDVRTYNELFLVVSDRVPHCEALFELLSAYPHVKPVMVHGKQAIADRKLNVARVREGEYNTVIATTSLLGEGFDLPGLAALLLSTPMKFNGRIIQVVGRILRPSNKTQPRIYDPCDMTVEILQKMYYSRYALYKKQGWLSKK